MSIPDFPRFYHSMLSEGIDIVLEDDESKHARVLRIREGDHVHLINGNGRLYEASVNTIKKKIELRVEALIAEEPRPTSTLSLAVAPTKNTARFEWIIEKATELGAHEIVPIVCEHSERTHLKTERLNKIAISAIKQSKNLWQPKVHELTSFSELLSITASSKWIAHCDDSFTRMHVSALPSSQSQLICIGPEGDFSLTEIKQAMEHGFNGLSLGHRRLRTETAAIAACVAANLLSEES